MAFTLGSILSGAGKILGGIIKASPVGTAISTAASVLRPKAPSGPTVLGNLPAIFTGSPTPSTGGGIMPGGSGAPSLPTLPGGQSTNLPVVYQPTDVRGASPSTYSTTAHAGQMGHYTRTGRFIRTTKTGKAIRRMNPANGHAIRRAARRIKSAEKMFRKVLSITHPGHKGKIRPKFGKKRA